MEEIHPTRDIIRYIIVRVLLERVYLRDEKRSKKWNLR